MTSPVEEETMNKNIRILQELDQKTTCDSNGNEEECLPNAKLVSLYARRFGKGQKVTHWSWF